MKDITYIAVLLDRSGSMVSIKKDTIGGYNNFVQDQKKHGDNALLTLVQFDTGGIDTLHESCPINQVPELNEDIYVPRGGTPLLDALGQTIESTGRALKVIPESERPDKVVFVIITDGQENASHKFTKEQIKSMVTHQESAYKWNFMYLGANVDAFDEASAVGISTAAAANFTPQNMAKGYDIASKNMASYRSSGNRASLNYSPEQRVALVSDDDGKPSSKFSDKTS